MPRLALVPGFTQTSASWRAVLDALDPRFLVHAIEVPQAPSFEDTALAIGDLGGTGVYCGYSMGGRLCLRLALDRPDLVRGLILVSATAGIEDPSDRAARIASDEELAAFVEANGVDAFLERWLAQPLFSRIPPDAPGLNDRRRLSVDFVAHSLRHLGAGTMDPMWSRLAELHMPVGIVWGALDRKYERVGQLLCRYIANSIPWEVPNAGHAILLEQPQGLASAIESTLEYMRD